MYKVLIIFLMLFYCQSSFAQNKKIIGFNETTTEEQISLESQFDKNLSAENIGETMKRLSAVPHHLSSPADKANAEYILSLYKKWGWDAQIETFHVLFPTPKTRLLEMTSPTSY